VVDGLPLRAGPFRVLDLQLVAQRTARAIPRHPVDAGMRTERRVDVGGRRRRELDAHALRSRVCRAANAVAGPRAVVIRLFVESALAESPAAGVPYGRP